MSDVIKVKPKKNYEWNQDNKFLYIRIPMPSHTSLKKVQVFLSDLILRVTSLQKKATHFLDLNEEVDYKSAESKFMLTDGELHATLKKKEPKNWQKLLVDEISLADLKIRRRQSEARYEANVKDLEENKKKIKLDYDRKATQEMMRFEQEERKKLDSRKQAQKDQAIKEIFSNVNSNTGKIEHQEKRWKEKQQLALKMIEEQEKKQLTQIQAEKKKNSQKKLIEQVQREVGIGKTSTKTSKSNSMFTEEDVSKYDQMRQNVGQTDYEQIPIRKAANQQVKFSKRAYPGLAARDSHPKEPPQPQGQTNKNSIEGDNESKNPLWLKDKGDKFFKDKNYHSAIEAYTEATNIDGRMVAAFSNRSLCYLKTFNYNSAISDCQKCSSLMQGQIGGSEQDNEKALLFLIKIQTRKAIAKAWKGQLQNAKSQIQQILKNHDSLKPQLMQELNKCLQQINLRQESIRYKLKGDQQVKLNNPEKAIHYYDQSIGVDKNEYSISNKALCLNKTSNFNKCIEIANEGIDRISFFGLSSSKNPGSKDSSQKNPNNLLLKLYFRKAKALQQLGKLKQTEQTIHKGLAIDSTDKDFIALLKQQNSKKNKLAIKEQKEKAIQLIKQGNNRQALQIYNKCLKMMQSSVDTQEYLGVLQNQCVCYLKLLDYDSIISTAIRIMKMVNNIQQKIVQFGGKKSHNMSQQQIVKISVRTLMRRANAYLHKNQIYNAKADLQKALQISPNDQNVQKEMEKLKKQLSIQ